ncbi:MAG: right-handed parallel beta-helix repeat-containing protein, partial [Sphingobacteriales bacterium]
HDITISGDSISGGAMSCISLVNCYNIHITNCKLVNSSAMGVNLSQCSNIIVDDCYVANVSTGVHASNSRSISVLNNKMKNISGLQPGGTTAEFENVANDAKDASSNSAINNQIIN